MMLWYLLLISFDCLRVLGQKNMFVKDIGAAHDASWATTQHPKDNKNTRLVAWKCGHCGQCWPLAQAPHVASAQPRTTCDSAYCMQHTLWQICQLWTLSSKCFSFLLVSLVTLVFGIAGIAVRLCKAVTNGNTRVAGCQCRARPGVQFIDWIKTVLTASWTSAFYVLLPYLAIKLCKAFHKFSANIQRFESERQNQSQYNPKSKHFCWKRRQKRAVT